MKKLVIVVLLILVLPYIVKAQESNEDTFSTEGQVYVNNFDNLSGLTLNENFGTITSENLVGTVLPNVPKALTLENTSSGILTAVIDLGQTYDKLYVQYYTTVLNKSTAGNYTINSEVGQAMGASEAAHVYLRHNSPIEKQYVFFGQSAGGFLDTKHNSVYGSWDKIGMVIDRIALTVSYYVNDKLINTIAAQNRNLQYITFGGNKPVGYKAQYASLTVNTIHFQDIITNSNGVGNYKSHFVDYSSTYNTNYNGIDLSAIDKSNWSGLHSEPFDPNGGTNYIDGPVPYLFNAAGASGSSKIYAKTNSRFFLKRGINHKIETLARTNQLAVSSAGNYSSTVFNTLDAYGTGTMPTLDMSMRANPTEWEVHDAGNNIYKITEGSSGNSTGAFQENGLGLREVFALEWMTNEPGCWFADATHVYVRLWDETDPALQDISLCTNQRFSATPYTQIRNIQFRHGGILVSDKSLVENCEFTLGAGASVTDAIFRDNIMFDNWSGTDYGRTPTNSPPNEGYGSSGEGGLGVNELALVYRNTIENSYLAVNINSEAHDAVFAFNLIKNTIVNSITISGNNNGNPLRPSLIANNTVFCGGRHKNNDPYPLARPQPNHGFVHQNGGGGAFIFVNNMMLLHYNENTGFPLQNGNSSTNIMSFVTLSLPIAVGRMGYNTYYKTPISNSPATIFGQGGGNINAWSTTMALAGNFRDLDGVSNPDSTSEVVNTLPVTEAEYTDMSGKWLSTNATQTELGGGYYIDYAAYGISKDLAGNPLGNNLNIGSSGSISSTEATTYTFTDTWSPSNPNGIASYSDDIIIASGNAIIDTNTTCNSIIVNPGSSLSVDAGVTLTAINELTFESSSSSYSSLILNGTINGTLNYERHVNINGSGETGSNDLISAPLTGQAFNTFVTTNPNVLSNSENTLYLFGPFDKVSGEYLTYSNTETATLEPGIGYRAASSDNGTFTFTGVANSEIVSLDIINSGPTEAEWNLIGNPYPSYLNVQAFLNHDVDPDMDDVVTNLNLMDVGTAAIYGYDGSATDGWIIYNLANTTSTTVIAPGQGFFVSADTMNAALYDLEFTPIMRSTGSSDDFIEGRTSELIYLKLIVRTNSDTFKTEFYFDNNASLGFDLGYDASLFRTPADFALYSHLVQDNTGDAIALQSLNLSNLSGVTIPLGVNANQGQQITFSVSDFNLPGSINIYLDDNEANITTLLNNSDYVFTPTNPLSGTGRFFLRTSEDSLSTTNNSLDNLSFLVLNTSKELLVSGQLKEKATLNLYDIQGRNVISILLDNSSIENRIDVSTLSDGIYIAKVFNITEMKTKKLIINN